MAAKRPSRIPARLDILLFPLPIQADQLLCRVCHSPLDIHQPSVTNPDRLLGVCEPCDLWSAIYLVPSRSEAVMVQLPDRAGLTEADFGATVNPGSPP